MNKDKKKPPKPLFTEYVKGKVDINILFSFVFGVIFIAVMLIFASVISNPSPFAVRVFITVLALAAAGVGAMIPGVINAEVGGFVRAGGAIALFVIVYFFQPKIEDNFINIVFPSTSGEEVAETLLTALDRGESDQAWSMFSPIAQAQLDGNGTMWQQLFETVREPLGAAATRQLVGANNVKNPPGMPVGGYRTLLYESHFDEEEKCRQEIVVLRATSEEEWTLFSYQISYPEFSC